MDRLYVAAKRRADEQDVRLRSLQASLRETALGTAASEVQLQPEEQMAAEVDQLHQNEPASHEASARHGSVEYETK